MKRIIDTLNEMSFDLPDGWQVTSDKYNIANGQGFLNKENYLSDDGRVISFFEIHRDPDDFFESYNSLTAKYNKLSDRFELEKQFSMKIGDFNFPVYVIKGYHEKLIYIVQVFINCGDCLGCFMITLTHFDDNIKKVIAESPLFSDLIKILRTVE